MTTPDHRPYLRESDLRTPEDVLAWLGEGLQPPNGPMRLIGAWHVRIQLEARLDRERRRAFRRGAKHHWTWFSCGIREYERRVNQEGLISDSDALESLEIDLSRALAFRAAARAK